MSYQPAPAVQEVGGLPSVPSVAIQPLLRQVYMWMTLAMLVTTASALVISSVALELLVTNPAIIIVAIVAQLGLVLALSWGMQRMSVTLAQILFFVYAASVGVTLSLILLVYEGSTVISAFATTAVLFFVMTMFGLTTRVDLTRYSSYFMIGLVGLFIALIVNAFIGSSTTELLLSFVGVVLFSGLTAYDTQRIQRMAQDPRLAGEGEATMSRLAIMGALGLYLNFLNLFIFLLRLFGGGRD
ncbi:MAG: Bax inhibitor-1/YccA family protein [Anaerolineaceae bacterium]|nr:Bax inhibitor-1/YccA family protein [Anaerolineaceae bacterium]